MKFPPLHGVAVYAGYRPTREEIQTPAVDVPVSVRINQLSKWQYSAYFADSKPRQPVRNEWGEPIRGQITHVIDQLANRFERVIMPPQWYTFRGERAPYTPTDKPHTGKKVATT